VRCRLRNPGHRIPTIIPTASLSIQTGKGGAASIGGTETDTEIAPLIQKVGAASIAEHRLIAELQEAKSYLLSEGERIEKEVVRYANLTQMALASAMIIFDLSPNGIPRASNKTLPKSRRLRPRRTSVRSGKVLKLLARSL
jgi:hypothetical protein